MKRSNKTHWETIYATRDSDQLSWTQDIPNTSLDFIHSFHLLKTAKIIDIGGGDSKLVDYLLNEGYEDITVLDISETALAKAKSRLGENSKKIKWIVSDIIEFVPTEQYEVWHDRATFHFLTNSAHIKKYLDTARRAVIGYLTIGTFSQNGPTKCSGLEIKQYSETTLQNQLKEGFSKIRCVNQNHITPFKMSQNFLFCSFKIRV